ncbi:DUF1194 domain-containing protein [uncultured Pelagimonas sp.]|uniref:DUF1194 domain-containing protein n=1 Tax=uncultured Pelagimonas sp. TaxID=1618102 RepID=UPI002627F529|nr:DUF1194 domain-containing protein [uncultured Pelagimonas sp.]
MRRWLWIAISLWAGMAQADCRQALALGLDVSGSVDEREYRLQLDGLAGALLDPEVVAAFLTMPDAPARLVIYEWSGPTSQRIVQRWTEIRSREDLAQIATRLTNTGRALREPSTALGRSKAFGATLLAQHPTCWRHVLDISGDGESNTGPRPQDVTPPGVTINGLVIGGDGQETEVSALSAYFRTYVIQGADAFVEVATGFDDYQSAMSRKLKRELTVLVLSRNP